MNNNARLSPFFAKKRAKTKRKTTAFFIFCIKNALRYRKAMLMPLALLYAARLPFCPESRGSAMGESAEKALRNAGFRDLKRLLIISLSYDCQYPLDFLIINIIM